MGKPGTCDFCNEPSDEAHHCSVLYDTAQSSGIVDKLKEMLGLSVRRMEQIPFGALDLVRQESGEHYVLSETTMQIGRDRESNLISIPDDASVSRNHAWIVYLHGSYWVEDLGSTNGTSINGRRISKRTRIVPGDHLHFGKCGFTVTPRSTLPMFGRDYEVINELGRGGMGVVWQALDRKNRRMVAIKQLNLEASMNEDRKENRFARFKREAMLGVRLRHPNIVKVHEIKIDAPISYYVMEFIEGQTLRQYMESHGGRLSAEEFLPLLEQICAALHHAHSMKITHRDVKPENIFITPSGAVKLTDFGIARAIDTEPSNLTKSGFMLGTLTYASPEQINNARKVDHRSDIFSLGTLSYEVLAGHPPFGGQGIVDTVTSIINSVEVPLDELNKSINRSTASAIGRAIRKDPCERYQSALEFAEAYRSALTVTAA